jgi:hypothetical protein
MSSVLPKSARHSLSGTGETPRATGLEADPHSKRIILDLDLAEWYARLARLAELREAQREQ